MDKHIDIKMVLRAFEVIRTKGERQGDSYFYKGLFAESSYDGYTIVIRDHHTSMTVGFHNTFQLNAPGRSEREEFMHALMLIAEED